MDCPSDPQLAALVDGRRLPAPELAALHEHLASCSSCSELVTQLARAGDGDARPASGESRSHYVLADRLARGGMGVVYRATDAQLGRSVALKFLPANDDDDHSRAAALEVRFLREALITARLQHPSIVPIYQSGRWPSGEVFYAMRLVSGRSLRDRLREATTLAERLALLPSLLAATDAVAYAHEQRIIHRDLKPANIMCGPFGETVVIDWGLAKDLADRAAGDDGAGAGETVATTDDAAPVATTDDAALTHAGSIMGSPEYVAPEQARGEVVDERADVFALGAILCHLLTAAPPRQGASAQALFAAAAAGAPVAAAYAPSLPRELLAIAGKAMAADARDRYPSARELAADLRRFTTGQLVAAHAYSLGALARRWLGRHRVVVGVATVLLVVLGVSQTLSLRRILRERQRAVDSRDALVLEQAAAQLDRDPTATIVWLEQYRGHDGARLSDLAVEAQARGVARHVFRVPDAANTEGDFSRDGRLFAGRAGAHIVVWDTTTGRAMATRPAPHAWLALRFSPDGRRLAFVGLAESASAIAVWDVASGQLRTLNGRDDAARADAIAWSPDGTLLASTDWQGVVRVWEARSGQSRVIGRAGGVLFRVGFSRDGRTVFTLGDKSLWRWSIDGNGDGTGNGSALVRNRAWTPLFARAADNDRVVALGDDCLYRFDLDTGDRRRFPLPDDGQRLVAIAPDGSWAALSGGSGNLHVLSLADGSLRLLGHPPRGIAVVAVTPDGRHIATGGRDGVVRLWDPRAGEVGELRAAVDGAVRDLVFARAGRWLATATDDRTERLWRLPATPPIVWRDHREVVHQVVFAPDGRTLASASSDETVQLHGLDGGATRTLRGHTNLVLRVAFAPDGRTLASASYDGSVRIWDVAGGAPRVLAGHGGPVFAVAFAPDGRTLFSASLDGTVRVWNIADGRARVLDGRGGPLAAFALTPDGGQLATAAESGDVLAWDWRAGTSRRLCHHAADVRGLGYSGDGRLLVSGDAQGVIHVAGIGDASERSWRQSHEVVEPTFAPDGQRLATIDGDVIRLWRRDGTLYTTLAAGAPLWRLAFSADGALIAGGGYDGSVRLWSSDSGRLRGIFHADGRIAWVTFAPDGRSLAAASFDGSARVWDVSALPPLAAAGDTAALPAWLAGFTSAVLDDAKLPTTLQDRR